MHSISEQGLALIRQFEGFSAKPYICPAGKWTIGYGHVIGAGEQFLNNGISLQAAEIMLKQDVNVAEQGVKRCVRVDITQNQYDALVCLTYNIGIQAFEKSMLLRYLNENNTEMASQQFGRWIYAGGQRLDGLVRRRAAESLLFSTET